MRKLLLAIMLVTNQAIANSELVIEHATCEANLYSCETHLDHALAKDVSSEWYQDPFAVFTIGFGSFILGAIFGASASR